MDSNRKMVSMKLSERTRKLVALLADRHDTSATAVVEQAIREKAAREEIKFSVPTIDTEREEIKFSVPTKDKDTESEN
jgi:hypothetical protein